MGVLLIDHRLYMSFFSTVYIEVYIIPSHRIIPALFREHDQRPSKHIVRTPSCKKVILYTHKNLNIDPTKHRLLRIVYVPHPWPVIRPQLTLHKSDQSRWGPCATEHRTEACTRNEASRILAAAGITPCLSVPRKRYTVHSQSLSCACGYECEQVVGVRCTSHSGGGGSGACRNLKLLVRWALRRQRPASAKKREKRQTDSRSSARLRPRAGQPVAKNCSLVFWIE